MGPRMEPRTVEIALQGRRIQIRTTLAPESLEEIVRYANRKLAEVADAGVTSPHTAALLALLSVVEELARERKNLGALKERIRMKSALILDMLGSAPAEGAGDDPPAGGMTI